MKAIMVMFDSLNRRLLAPYGCDWTHTPNFMRLAQRAVTFDNCYAGSLPCMPARREIHTGRYNFLHRSWGPIECYDDSMPEILKNAGVYTHLVTDHWHYWEEGGANYQTKYNSFEYARGQEGDPWKGHVKWDDIPPHIDGRKDSCGRQEFINRHYMQDEQKQSIAVTFQNGLEFLENNHAADRWFLQLEAFDPHEPFFSPERYKALYPHTYDGVMFDWPGYHPLRETPDQIQHCRYEYAALLSMCDAYLGKVLDLMDRYDLWRDTMLIVNTDHGFLLGEHNWWGKVMMPFYDEIAHIPLFVWDPRNGIMNERRQTLVQTIDLTSTLLDFFALQIPEDMTGKPLCESLRQDTKIREYALFGMFGAHVNITDGRYVYMRAPLEEKQDLLYNYVLMPNSYPGAINADIMRTAELHPGFPFSKGVPLLKIKGGALPQNFSFPPELFRNEHLLFDLLSDPEQQCALNDPKLEQRMIHALVQALRENDAPLELLERLGLSAGETYSQ